MNVEKHFMALGDMSLPPWEEMDGEWREVNEVEPLRKRSVSSRLSFRVFVFLSSSVSTSERS